MFESLRHQIFDKQRRNMMKKIIIILVAFVVLFLFFTEGLAAPLQKSIIPSEAKWVVHFDMQKYVNTKLHSTLKNHEIMNKLRDKNDEILKSFGIDLLNDIKSVTLYGLGVEEKETVICVSGNFKEDQLIKQIKKKEIPEEISYLQYTIYSGGSSEFLTFPKEDLALIGQSEKSIKTALDVAAEKKQDISASPLKSELDKAPSDAFLTAVVDNISALTKHKKPVILTKMGNALFTLMENKENLSFNLNISTLTSEDAKNMEQIVRGLIAMANLQKEDIPAELKPPEDFIIQTKGNRVQMGFTYSIDDIIKLIDKRGKFPPFSFKGEFSPLT